MTRLVITALTFGALAVAAGLGIAWLVVSPGDQRWEPAVNTLALLAGISGIFAERWAAERERRLQAVESIRAELAHDVEVLDDDAFSMDPDGFRRRRVYPRLVVSAVDSAFASGALSRRRDGELIRRLHAWRDIVNTVNRRLDLTESLTFATGSMDEVEAFNRALHRSDGYLTGVRELLVELQSYLDTSWKAR
jgi:ABC-type transporter Mla subunit MlaD